MSTKAGYIVILAVAAISLFLFHLLLARLDYSEKTVEVLGDRHTEQLRILLERSKLLTSLTTAAFGVAGGLLLKVKTSTPHHLKRQALWIFVLAGCSLFLGYNALSGVIWMLDSEFFNLYSLPVSLPFDLQFFFFLASVVILGHFFLRASEFTTPEKPECQTSLVGRTANPEVPQDDLPTAPSSRQPKPGETL